MSSRSTIETYERPTRQSLGLSPDEWEELNTYLEEWAPLFETARSNGVEMVRPAIRSADDEFEYFDPRGWVGTYPSGIAVRPDKFDDEEFQQLRTDVAGWLETLGPGTSRALLPYLPEQLHNWKSLLTAYSRHLTDYTEAVLAGRPPVETEFVHEKGPSVRGRPLMAPTARKRAQGSTEVVSQRVDFTVDTLPNLLLVRFHAELAGRLSDLGELEDALGETLADRINYHREFIETGLPENLFEQAMEVDFQSPDVLAETRQLAGDQMQDVVDLWEAYLEDVAMQTDIAEGFDTTLKPMSTLYELWVLRQLLDSLEAIHGQTVESVGDGLRLFRVGDLRLRYDTSIKRHSRYLSEFGGSPGKPDFALERRVDGEWECLWIGDAKYKRTFGIDGDDAERFLRYLVDCLPASKSTCGTLFCASGRPRSDVGTEDYTIEFKIVRPTSSEIGSLRELFEELNGTA